LSSVIQYVNGITWQRLTKKMMILAASLEAQDSIVKCDV